LFVVEGRVWRVWRGGVEVCGCGGSVLTRVEVDRRRMGVCVWAFGGESEDGGDDERWSERWL